MSVLGDRQVFSRSSETSRVTSASEAAELVRAGDHIVTSGCGAAPIEFLAALAARSDLERVYLSHATAWGPLAHLDGDRRPKHIRLEAYFLPPLARRLHQLGSVDYIPLTFSHMECMLRDGALKADIVAVTCSPPDAEGFCSLGPFVSYLPAAMQAARLVIAECSPNWPRTNGAARIHVSTIDKIIPVSRQPITSSGSEELAEAPKIAANVLTLVNDGATIQIGRGAIPNAVAAELTDRRDLGVHSEMLSDWIVDLAERGIVTGARKTNYPGRIVTSFMDGSERLYEFANASSALLLQPIYEVNDPRVISSEPNFVAINSAVEVDLTGQINAESIGGHLISGSGGLLDFAIGAALSRGGKFIITMPSTAKGGDLSRIVPRMASGAAVTVPRTLAHYVITEYGIADLRGCTLRERARRLIAIAHPKFREHLVDAAGLSSSEMV